jgi:predicted GIY-YIG superfamily endonuclease
MKRKSVVLDLEKDAKTEKKKKLKKKQVHACYLIKSCKTGQTSTYIGYTVNPARRIRQHKQEIKGGAKFTRRMQGELEFVCVVWPFPDKRNALQFEKSWQRRRTFGHPTLTTKTYKTVPKKYVSLVRRMEKLDQVLTLAHWTRKAQTNKKDQVLNVSWINNDSRQEHKDAWSVDQADYSSRYSVIVQHQHVASIDDLQALMGIV